MVPSPLPLLPLLPLCSSDSSPFPSLPFPNPFRIGAATTIASALVANPGTFFLSPESLGLTNMLMNAGEPFPFLSFSPLHSLTHTHMHHACHSSPSPSLSFPSFPPFFLLPSSPLLLPSFSLLLPPSPSFSSLRSGTAAVFAEREGDRARVSNRSQHRRDESEAACPSACAVRPGAPRAAAGERGT